MLQANDAILEAARKFDAMKREGTPEAKAAWETAREELTHAEWDLIVSLHDLGWKQGFDAAKEVYK